MDGYQLASLIKQRAREMGFTTVGIAPAAPSAYRQYFRDWLDAGNHGSMAWLEGRFDERVDPATYVPGANSVICVATNYKPPEEDGEHPFEGKIARYARGDDYHDLIKARLHELADFIRQQAPDAVTRACVDTAPVLEKELAQRAGLGWIGKNTLLIHPKIGSYTLLGEVITTLTLPADNPGVDRCGTCRRCLDACPTGALTGPHQLDARRCISYLTIENRGDIPPELRGPIGNWLFGCDICQEVCPWNHKSPVGTEIAFRSRFGDGGLDARQVAQWSPEEYRARLKGSAMKRVKLPILQRNALTVVENARTHHAADAPASSTAAAAE